MGLVFNMVGGGGGGLSPNSAVIHVTAPVGSTITFSKGGVIAKVLDAGKSHVNAEDTTLADWYYAVSAGNYGTWTVTATLNADSASENVAVSANRQYDVALSYRLWLYNAGDMMTAITGGYSTTSGGTFNNDATAMSLRSGNTTKRYAACVNAVDLSRYNTLVAGCYTPANPSNPDNYQIGIGSGRSTLENCVRIPNGASEASEVQIDISTATYRNSCYVTFSNAAQNVFTYVTYIYAVRL